ncbi:MAG: polymer-forming cytoskeletal protein [Campylobacterales bacterium]
MFWGPKNSKNQPSKGESRELELEPMKGREPEFKAATIIAEGTYLNGRIEVKNQILFVDGKIEGGIYADISVIIGEKGKVSHKIKGGQISVSGQFKGEIDCDWIEIKRKGEVKGEISCNQLVIERGGVFEGKNHLKIPIPRPEFGKVPVNGVAQVAEDQTGEGVVEE